MRNLIFLLLFVLVLPVIVVSQDDSLSFTCSDLIREHMNSCERCKNGDKCHTRRDLLEFCSGKDEQELIVVDPGPENCGCPTYGYYYYRPSYRYYSNYYSHYNNAYYYNGPSYRYGYNLNLSVGLSGGYYLGTSYYSRSNYGYRGGHNSYGGYNRRGNYYDRGNYHGYGNHQGYGNYNQNGHHHGNGSHQFYGGYHQSGHYGSRPHSRRGG